MPEDPATLIDDEIAALRAIVEGTVRSTGEVFIEALVRHLATTIGVNHAFVTEFAGVAARVRTLANWGTGAALPNVEYELAGTPCEAWYGANFATTHSPSTRSFPSIAT